MVCSDITRPRRCPGASVCSSVLVVAIVTMKQPPSGTRSASATGSEVARDSVNRSTPNDAPATTSQRSSPATRDRTAMAKAATMAPNPTAAWSDEKVCGPPPSWRLANDGSSTEYGMPTTAKKASPPRMALSAGSRRTCSRPSRMSASIEDVTVRRTAGRGNVIGDEGGQDREVGDGVGDEAPTLADERNEGAGDGRTDQTGAVE